MFGIVYAPALGDLYVTLGAGRSATASLHPDAPVRRLADCGLRDIRTRAPDPQRLTAVASRSHMSAEGEAWMARWPIAARRDAGSSLKFCLIAKAKADLYPRLGPTMEWDTAAGDAVLRSAGGMVTTIDGAPLRYGKYDEGYRNPHFVAWGTSGAMVGP